MEQEEIQKLLRDQFKEGRIVIETIDGLMTMAIDEFIKQPEDGMLYDLNRDELTCLTLIDQAGWINNYAVAKTIRALKEKVDKLESAQSSCNKALEMQKEVAVKFWEWMDDGRCDMNFNDEDGNPTIVDTEGFYDYFITNIYKP